MSSFERFLSFITKGRFWSLNFKLAMAIILAAFLAIGAFFACSVAETRLAQVLYLSETAKETAVNAKYKSLQSFISERDVDPSDTEALTEWMDEQPYTQLLIYDNNHDLFSAGYVVDTNDTTGEQNTDSALAANKEDVAQEKETRIDRDSFETDLYNRVIRFADEKEYYVYINVNREKRWYSIMSVVKVLMAAAIFLLAILLYNSFVLRRLIRLADTVGEISSGDLKKEIRVTHHDELSNLGISVDNMRNTLLETMENEKTAWDANAQLITAMSHDIRTPLTSLIGYLDIIEGRKYSSEEDLDHYIRSCREKAFQLKDLSDELFRYFLVFGNQTTDRQLETLDAGILFQQLLGEHVAELVSYGRSVDFQYNIPEGKMVNVEISMLQRLFDNLFSNLMKYANRQSEILIKAFLDWDSVVILFRNQSWEEARAVESTQIGVKTCKRICQDLNGTFRAIEENGIYTTEITLPLAEEVID